MELHLNKWYSCFANKDTTMVFYINVLEQYPRLKVQYYVNKEYYSHTIIDLNMIFDVNLIDLDDKDKLNFIYELLNSKDVDNYLIAKEIYKNSKKYEFI